ncbi:MAG: DUF433 domain-containing protein [Oceanicaulis sp.]
MKDELAHPRISIDPEIMLGKPCITGTRIPIYLILRYLASGQSESDIREAFPNLRDGDVQAVLQYAADAFDVPLESAAE